MRDDRCFVRVLLAMRCWARDRPGRPGTDLGLMHEAARMSDADLLGVPRIGPQTVAGFRRFMVGRTLDPLDDRDDVPAPPPSASM